MTCFGDCNAAANSLMPIPHADRILNRLIGHKYNYYQGSHIFCNNKSTWVFGAVCKNQWTSASDSTVRCRDPATEPRVLWWTKLEHFDLTQPTSSHTVKAGGNCFLSWIISSINGYNPALNVPPYVSSFLLGLRSSFHFLQLFLAASSKGRG